MLAICSPSQTSTAGMPNRHYWQLNPSQPASPWHPSAAGLDAEHPHHPQTPYDHPPYDHNLAYRPRVDEYPYPGIHHGMASPTSAMASTPQHHDYPDDPSFETASNGRLEMAQEDVDAIIRNKRKVRDPKACYACHRRKVKCNRELPCDSCVKRDHPELCSYERPTKRRRIAMTTSFPRSGSDGSDVKDPSLQSGPNVTVPKEQWERINKQLQELREQVAATSAGNADDAAGEPEEENAVETANGYDTEREGIHAPSNQMGTMHLGSRSVLAYMMGLGRTKSSHDSALSLLNENILPKLGLDNDSVTYPFVDLWSTDNSIEDISGLCSAIPDDHLCKEFFYSYRDVACTIYPVVPQSDEFEATLNYMLANRAKSQRENIELDQTSPMGISLSRLALVFAVLASGAQCSGISAKERELTSQVYICCSYQALRMANFLTHPSLDTIQALLIITNVLSYNMNPGVAYIFLGLVVRMAFSMGLQINQSGLPEHESWLRRRTWWAIAWQDSHFSVSYDRPTATILCSPDIPYSPGSAPGNRSYAETMYSIIRLTQGIIQARTMKPHATMSWSTIQRHRETVASIIAEGTPHLRERTLCTRTTHHIERIALKLHSSYIISELCRPALKEHSDDATPTATPAQSPSSTGKGRKSSRTSSHSPPADPALPSMLRRECLHGLESTVAAYIELYQYSEFTARSWIGIQRAISAAFLLGTLPEANQDPRTVGLLRELERCIAMRTMEDPAFEAIRASTKDLGGPATADLSSDAAHPEGPVWARSMTKSLNALGKLNATLAGLKAGSLGAPQTAGGVQSMFMDSASMRTAQPPMPTQPRIQTSVPHVRTQYPMPGAVKQEPYSPSVSSAGVVMMPAAHGLGPITPDSTSSATSGEWTYGNLQERSAEYVQPALWG